MNNEARSDHSAPQSSLFPAHLEMAREYIRATQAVLGALPPDQAIKNVPALYLAAHALELSLKNIARWLGDDRADLFRYSHSPQNVLVRVREAAEGLRILQCAEDHIASKWASALEDRGDSPTNRRIGIDPTGRSNLSLEAAVCFFNQLQTSPYPLRYFDDPILMSIPFEAPRSRPIPVCQTTVIWGCAFIADLLEERLRSAHTSTKPQPSA